MNKDGVDQLELYVYDGLYERNNNFMLVILVTDAFTADGYLCHDVTHEATISFVTGSMRATQVPVFKLLRSDFEVFGPSRVTRCTDEGEI